MTERFVSAGTMFVASGGDGGGSEKNDDDKGKRDEGRDQQQLKGRRPEWEAVQQELEAERKMREEQRRKMVGGEEKSLYDILQANKAAKQAAFEEQNRIKNQFRALDDDEVDFLDGVRASQRKEEEARRRETEERLRVFRERRALDEGGRRLRRGPEEVEGVQSHGEDEDENVQDKHEDWAVSGRKRKRTKGRDGKGLARRKSSAGVAAGVVEEEKQAEKRTDQGKPAAKDPYAAPRKLGLVDYGSGEDSDGDEG